MVVIEVDRDFENFDQLLGLHSWAEFLQKPSEEQLDKVSKVFYCTYNTGRLVERDGLSRSLLHSAYLLKSSSQVESV